MSEGKKPIRSGALARGIPDQERGEEEYSGEYDVEARDIPNQERREEECGG